VPHTLDDVPGYAHRMRAALEAALEAFAPPPPIVAEELNAQPQAVLDAQAQALSIATLLAALGALRAFVADLKRFWDDAENSATADAADQQRNRAAPSSSSAAARAPWLVEESALREMLGQAGPATDGGFIAAALGLLSIETAAGTAHEHGHGALPRVRRAPEVKATYDARALLTRDGMPALYDLYAGCCRALAQQPYPARVALPPPLDAASSSARLRSACGGEAEGGSSGGGGSAQQARRGPTDLSVCPRCGASPQLCPAAVASSASSIANQVRRHALRALRARGHRQHSLHRAG
jgi:uncharacterized membrane protein YgcG